MTKMAEARPSAKIDYRFSPKTEKAMDAALGTVLFLELLLLFTNTMLRAISRQSIVWSSELAEYALSTLAFIGGTVAYHRGMHMSIHMLVDRLPAKVQVYLELLGYYFILLIAGFGVYLGSTMLIDNWDEYSSILQIPRSWGFVPFVLGMAFLAVIVLRRLAKNKARQVLGSGGIMLALVAAWFLAQRLIGPWNGGGGLLFVIILLIVLLFLGLPVAYVLAITSYIYMVGSQAAPIIAVPFAMNNGITSFLLLAIPFFILAGDIMTEGGLTKPLADWIFSLVKHLRGGLMQAVVVAMYIFSGISGSKIADVTAVGTTMRGMLKEQGYDRAESTAVFSAAGIMGETIPPSLIMMVLASITTLSVGTFFLTGVFPAALMAICLMIFIAIKARRNRWPQAEKASWGERGRLTLTALPALLVPGLLVVGIVGGFATPTEASSFAVVYAILIAAFLYRTMKFRDFSVAIGRAAVNAGMILFIVSAGGALSNTLTIANLPTMILAFINTLGGSKAVFMVASIITMFIMGSLLEGMPSLIVFGPMLLSIAATLGMNQLHYGIVLLFAMGMGTFVPPFGICFYVTCSVLESTVESSTRKLAPYLIIMTLGLAIVALFPELTLALPRMLHLSVK